MRLLEKKSEKVLTRTSMKSHKLTLFHLAISAVMFIRAMRKNQSLSTKLQDLGQPVSGGQLVKFGKGVRFDSSRKANFTSRKPLSRNR